MKLQQQPAIHWSRDAKPRCERIAVNGRYRAHKVAGQQRYANEVIARLAPFLDVIEPASPLKGWRGHGWEQAVLPHVADGRLLWSPCQAGPVFMKKQVITFHDLFAIENPEWFSTGYALWYKRVMPMLARHARRIIAVSEYTQSRLVNLLGIEEEKIDVIHSGISEDFHPRPLPLINGAIKTLGIPSRKYLLSVSSLEPRKNVPRLLEAWKRVRPMLPPDCWLVLAGAKGNSGVFAGERLDVTDSRVYQCGYVEESLLPALYSGAQAFLYPSLAEGFGLPALEAMACGVPVLTANTTSLPEVTGDAAMLIDPLRVDDIAQGILDLVSSEERRQEQRQRGLRQVRQFRWDRTAQRTLEVLQNAHSQGSL